MRTSRAIAIALVACFGLLLPAISTAATAAPDAAAKPDKGKGRGAENQEVRDCVREARQAYRAAKKQARTAKRAAFKAAKNDYREAAAPHKEALKAALDEATTDEERDAAVTAYKEAVGPLRAERRSARKDAIAAFRGAVKDARWDFHDARRECRASKA